MGDSPKEHIKQKETLLEKDKKTPTDYKFWCFSGKVECISLHFNRFERHTTLSFDKNFEPGGLRFDLPVYPGEFSWPSNCQEMVRIAEALAAEFHFMRVDLYNLECKIYFGELTAYPGGVTTKFEPESTDYFLGKRWEGRTI